MQRSPWLWLCLVATAAAVADDRNRKVDFEGAEIDGERVRPELGYISERPRPKFACDASKMTAEQFEACFSKELHDVCGLQLIERERFLLDRQRVTGVPSLRAKTLGAVFPYSLELANGAVLMQEATEYNAWDRKVTLLRDVSPPLLSIDDFVATPNSFLMADRSLKRVFVFTRSPKTERVTALRQVQLPERTHALLGVLANEKYVIATGREVLMVGANGKSGRRLKVPVDRYELDSTPDEKGRVLLTGSGLKGKVYVISAGGELSASFEKEPGYVYRLFPNGLIASANLGEGNIRIRDRKGRVLSKATLGRPLYQFGLFRQKTSADLYFVANDGVGILYGDGFEKSFLTTKGQYARVVQAENNVLAVSLSEPSHADASRMVEKRVEYYFMRPGGLKTSRMVEGICPEAIRLAERALNLKPSLKAQIKDGRFKVQR
ncbi:MAG: hypothetical protein ACT4TC_07045 [Myxococcaceae bacterium]